MWWFRLSLALAIVDPKRFVFITKDVIEEDCAVGCKRRCWTVK